MATTAQKKGIVQNVQGNGHGASPAPDTVKEAEKKAKRDARAAAVKRILAFMAENAKLPIIADLKLFVHEPGQRGRKGSGLTDKLRAFFKENASATEMQIFKTFNHIGRPEMAKQIRLMIMAENPADRIWVSLDDKSETYTVAGKGENPPKDWKGYVPAKKEDL